MAPGRRSHGRFAEGKSPRTVQWDQPGLTYFTSCVSIHRLTEEVDQIAPTEIRQQIRRLQSDVRARKTNPRRPTENKSLSPQTVAGWARTLRAFSPRQVSATSHIVWRRMQEAKNKQGRMQCERLVDFQQVSY